MQSSVMRWLTLTSRQGFGNVPAVFHVDLQVTGICSAGYLPWGCPRIAEQLQETLSKGCHFKQHRARTFLPS